MEWRAQGGAGGGEECNWIAPAKHSGQRGTDGGGASGGRGVRRALDVAEGGGDRAGVDKIVAEGASSSRRRSHGAPFAASCSPHRHARVLYTHHEAYSKRPITGRRPEFMPPFGNNVTRAPKRHPPYVYHPVRLFAPPPASPPHNHPPFHITAFYTRAHPNHPHPLSSCLPSMRVTSAGRTRVATSPPHSPASPFH